MAQQTNPVARPADLELHVELVTRDGQSTLEVTLHSAASVVPFHHTRIPGRPLLGSLDSFREWLTLRLDNLEPGQDVPAAVVDRELVNLGEELYRRLFSPELRQAYRRFRSAVHSLHIVSREPWIPWEMVKPREGGDDGPPFEDDFLCRKFQLTRWLPGGIGPATTMAVHRLAVLEARQGADSDLKTSERLAVIALADGSKILDVSPANHTCASLLDLLETGSFDLLHVIGHGRISQDFVEANGIPFPDRPFTPLQLGGRIEDRVRRQRPLVFLNVCHGGVQGWSLTGLGGWVDAWVGRCGCGAFIAPLWSVHSRTASHFAELFYAGVKAGQSVAEAASHARAELTSTPFREAGGRTAFLAYAVYAHPQAWLKLGGDAAAASRLPRSVPPEIRRHILDSAPLVARKTAGFVGRGWLFERIDRFVAREPRGYFLLLGDPGIGKTAVLAQWVRRNSPVHHFNVRTERINRPETFLENVCAQLIATYTLGHTSLPPTASRDASFFLSLLREAARQQQARGEKVVLLVDALDEVDPETCPPGVNSLYLPSELPLGVYIVATSRRGELPLRLHGEFERFELEKAGDGNLADVREYVASQLELAGLQDYLREQKVTAAAFIEEMAEHSEGNFMYLSHVLPAVANGIYRQRQIAELPRGLADYYLDHWRLMKARDEAAWFAYKLPVLAVLTILDRPVSLELLQALPLQPSRVRGVLAEWEPFLDITEARDAAGQPQRRYRIYHASFLEFVAKMDQVVDERVHLQEKYGWISDLLLRELDALDALERTASRPPEEPS